MHHKVGEAKELLIQFLETHKHTQGTILPYSNVHLLVIYKKVTPWGPNISLKTAF